MPHCTSTVPLCTHGSRKTKGTDISYHRFPNRPLRSVWLRNLRRDNPRERTNTYGCSAHFTPDHFEPNKELIPRFKKRKMIKPSAVPTVFAFPKNRAIKVCILLSELLYYMSFTNKQSYLPFRTKCIHNPVQVLLISGIRILFLIFIYRILQI